MITKEVIQKVYYVVFAEIKMLNKIWLSPYLEEIEIESAILKDFEISQKKFDCNNCIGAIIWHENFPNMFKNYDSIKSISRFGAGIDNIDMDFCKYKNIRVTNVPDYGIDEVSDTALAFLLWSSRGVGFYNWISQNINNGSWESNIEKNIKRSSSSNLGIVGMGRIGSLLAKKATFLGFNVSFYDPYQIPGMEKVIGVKKSENFEQLISESDFISLNCDLNKFSEDLINEKAIKKMKYGASIINTSRGRIVNSVNTIFDYIEEGKLNYFATDVLREEPPSENLIKRIKNSPILQQKVLITPHTAFYSLDAFKEMRIKAATNLLQTLTSKKENSYETALNEYLINREKFK